MNLLSHKAGRGLVAFAFYFAEGAPIGFIWWALPTYLRQNKVEVDVIGASLAFLTLPWVLKFLWAPLIDRFRTRHFGFKKWIALSQLLMCLTLLPLIFIPIQGNMNWWIVLLFLHSLCAATQDVSVDAMIIKLVDENERGVLNGYMQAGMLLGRSFFGGGTLVLIQMLGVPATISIMILIVVCVLVLLAFIREPETLVGENKGMQSFWSDMGKTFLSKQTVFMILFALTAAAAFEFAGSMVGPFLSDKHVGMESIGVFLGIPVVACMLIGGLFGGFFADRMTRKKASALFLLAIIICVLLIATLNQSKTGWPNQLWMILFCCMYFFTGMFIASSYALFMDATDPKFAAVQFSTFMSATNCCELWVVWSGGIIVASQGYGTAFFIMAFVSLFSLLFLWKLKGR